MIRISKLGNWGDSIPTKSIEWDAQEVEMMGDLMAIGGKDLQETPVTGTIKINTTVAGAQFAPAISALSGGGYVIVWQDSGAGQIYAQRFSATGQPVGAELHLDSTQGGSAVWVSVAATAADGFVIAFQAGNFNQAEIFARRYDSANNPVGGLFAANTTSPNEQFNPHVSALDNGSLLFTWDTRVTLGNDIVNQEVRGRIYDASGQPIGNDFAIAPVTATDNHGLSAITSLPGGDFVVTWQRASNNSGNFEIVGQRYNSGGGTVGAQFQANTQTANSQYGNDVARLSDGGFVVSWVDPGNGNVGGRIVARHYDASGNSIGGEIVVDSKASGAYGRTVVTALANGGYVIAWPDNENDPNIPHNVNARAFGSNDQPLDPAFDMSFDSPFSANFFSDGAITLSNGNVVFTWDGPSVTPPGGQGTGQDIYMRVYSFTDTPPPITPTEGDDVLTDTAGSDTINALGGSDTITVTNGRDTVNGGSGSDLLIVSWGNATGSVTSNGPNVDANGGFSGYYSEGAVQVASRMVAYGQVERFDITTGSGNDELRGGGGSDRLTGGAGADSLYGNDGDDSIYGDVSDLILSGGTGIDTLYISGSGVLSGALSGFEALAFVSGANLTLSGTQFNTGLALNTLLSGTGNLTVNMDVAGNFISELFTVGGSVSLAINGTSGSDIFKLGNAVHTVNAGDGSDQIKGGNAADILNGGNGIDKINGAGGADILTGGGGNDVFKYANASDSGLGAAADQLTDFTIGGDRINFTQIDANAGLGGDQAFAFVGSGAFTGGGAGSIRFQASGGDLLVQVDVDGNGTADMEIILQGLNGQTLTGGDFVL